MACFLIGVTGRGMSTRGEALLGSVSDDPYDVRTFLRSMHPAGALAHIGTELVSTTEHTLIDRGYFCKPGETTRGLNAAGLAFTCAMLLEDENIVRTHPMADFTAISDALMRTCRSVDDAIALFQSAGAVDPPFSVLLADAKGNLAHLEAGNFGISVYQRYSADNPGMVFAVNCYLSPSFVQYNAPDAQIENRANNNRARRVRGRQLAHQLTGQLDPHSLARILSDHANGERDPKHNPLLGVWGYSICNHGTRNQDEYPHEDLPWGTVSAEILQPAQQLFWYCYGWPCGQRPAYGDQLLQKNSWGQFVPFSLGNGVMYENDVTQLTTIDGALTPAGLRFEAAS